MNLLNTLIVKVVLIYGAVLIFSYLLIRFQLINLTPVLAIFGVLLFLAELHTIFHFSGMLYCLWPRKYKKYTEINTNKNLEVNILICVCGEPVEIVKETIIAAKNAAKYYKVIVNPHHNPKVIVINDGFGAKKENWKEIETLSHKLGVHHITRPTNEGFKAGNINTAMKHYKGANPQNTIFIVFDADFSALPQFITEITKPMTDDNIDFVQSPQAYKNEVTWVSKAAAAHQSYFFDYICPAKANDNALFLCGTNFAIRQSALDAVGGMDTKYITEDYSTSLNLHLAGKKGVFIPEVLALGVAPSTLKGYYNQQRRWAKGTFDSSFANLGKLLFGKLSLRQKFHYMLSATYYLIGLRDLILMLATIPYLFLGISLIRANTFAFLTFVYAPLFLYNFIMYLMLFKEPIKSLILDTIAFPVFVKAFFGSVVGEKLAFIVTIKKYEKDNLFEVYNVQIIVMLVLAIGMVFSFIVGRSTNPVSLYINYFWAFFNFLSLSLGFFLMFTDHNKPNDEIAFAKKHNTITYNISPAKLILIPMLFIAFGTLIYKAPGYRNLYHNISNERIIKERTILPKKVPDLTLQVPAAGAYYGYYLPELNNRRANPTLTVIPGEKPSLALFYQDWGELSGFDKNFVRDISDQNVIPIITWEPWDEAKVEELGFTQTNYYPQQIISGKYDEFIAHWAKGAANYKKPFFLRFAHEMNGSWYPWGNIKDNKPEDYKKMWIHIHDIFKANGADNVIWLWAPNNTDAYGNSDSILSYYPGDEYVDWVGYSGFNWGASSFISRWVTFDQITAAAYAELKKLDKPIMVTETSSASKGGNKTEWFKETLTKTIPAYPEIKAVVFFHDDDKNADFSLLKGMDAYSVLTENIVDNNFYIKNPYLVEVPTK